MIELLVALFILTLLTVAATPNFVHRIQAAHVASMGREMQSMVDNVQTYMSAVKSASFDSNGHIKRTYPKLPDQGPDQIQKLNREINTRIPERNRYGQRYQFVSGAGHRVFIKTRIPVASVSAPPNLPDADVRRSGNYYDVEMMASRQTEHSANTHALRTKQLLRNDLPTGN